MRFLSNKIRDQFRPDHWRFKTAHSLNDGLQLFLGGQHAGGLTAYDSSVYGRNGTLSGFALTGATSNWVPSGEVNRVALDFDGSNDYVEIPTTTAFDGGYISFACWYYHVAAGSTYPRFCDRVYNGQFAFYINEAASSYGAALKTAGGTQDTTTLTGTPTLITGQWAHVAYVWDLANMLLYLNGDLASTTNFYNGGLATSASVIRIGQRVDGTNRQFEGRMADAGFWNRILSSEEVKQLAAARSDPTIGGWIVPATARRVIPWVSSGTTNYYIPNKMRYYRNRRVCA